MATRSARMLGMLLAAGLIPAAAPADEGEPGARYCTLTALDQFRACRTETRDDLFTAWAICRNTADEGEDRECLGEAREEGREAQDECREQLGARRALCTELGEGRIDPRFEPGLFDDPRSPTRPNPYQPLGVGNRWVYEGSSERVTVEVLDETKSIEGVTCIVVNDRVEEDGELVEDTDDWFGVRKDGSVAYCGEIARDFEHFEGDDPAAPELVSIEGSWKHGRDGALAGTLFPGEPRVGDVYRQEWAPGDAEDVARVVSTTYAFGTRPELDRHVPQALAGALCSAGDCVVTGEFTPLEPHAFEYKYYAPGVGLFLEVNPESGDALALVSCNFGAGCAALP